MARPIRVEFPGAIYHVMSRGVNGCTTFCSDEDRVLCLQLIERLVSFGDLIVHAICLMTNHFHMLCQTPVGALNRWMQQLLGQYTQIFNRRHERIGHLWQARYKAILVEPGAYFLECSRYIHLNPVRGGLVERPEEYPWSSFCCYAGSLSPLGWVDTVTTLSYFADSREYMSFVESGIQMEPWSPFDYATAGIVLGSDEFVRHVRSLLPPEDRWEDLQRIGELQKPETVTVDTIRNLVDEFFGHLSPCQCRRVLTYALRRFTLLTGRQVSSIVGMKPWSVSAVRQSLDQRLRADDQFRERMELLRQALVKRACIVPVREVLF